MDGAGEEDVEEKVTVLPTTETDAPTSEGPPLTDDQWKAIADVLNTLYTFRREDGSDPSKVFHKRVNKRQLPDYYEVIKDPMALSNIKQRVQNREYKTFHAFVRDCALIWHNAHTYNRPDAQAYVDASDFKKLMEEQFNNLVESKVIEPEQSAWPDLGEIPPVEDPVEEEEEDEDADGEGEEDDEDDEVDDSDDDKPRNRRRSGRASTSRRESRLEKDEPEAKKRRGRPPKVDTPMEARMKNVLKGIRKPKNDDGNIMIHSFEKLPDKQVMPEYYAEIKRPIAVEQIKKNQKRKKYHNMDVFMRDVDLMFENAKLFNEDDSQIYEDAVFLQKEAHRLAEIEKKKSDDEFVMEEGRKPRPDGIMHNGELWKVGDWVHIRNANDISQPIIAQIYRTWEDANGGPWVNACWYYRPEQTVHQYEKHFFPGEVVKTGQYRDHPIDDLVDRCFVMFFTRFSRGRPRGIPQDREVYVCEARYNEEKFKMNKIKTWASCLPDEVREKDYEMDLFDGIKKVKKVPSPLLHLLKDDGKENQEPPKPRWGVENAPPIVGGIYRGPRDENQSPPPEPTPSPPPQPPPAPARQATQTPGHDQSSWTRAREHMERAGKAFEAQPDTPNTSQHQSFAPQQRHLFQRQSGSPIQPAYGQQGQNHSQQGYSQQSPHGHAYHQQSNMHSYEQYGTPQTARYPQQPRYPLSQPQTNNVNRADAVYILSDTANAQIPADVRNQFQCDAEGHIIFFPHPPSNVHQPDPSYAGLGHSLKFKAAKLRRERKIKERNDRLKEEKRKRDEEATTNGAVEAINKPNKKAKTSEDLEKENDEMVNSVFETYLGLPLEDWVKKMDQSTDEILKSIHGDKFEEAKALHTRQIQVNIANARQQERDTEELVAKVKEEKAERQRVMASTTQVYRDDYYSY